jgi:hypothetical protein
MTVSVTSKPQILSKVNIKGGPIGLSNKKIEYHCSNRQQAIGNREVGERLEVRA